MFQSDPNPNAYHWTPAAQRRFVAVLAQTGSVQRACDAARMTRHSAYRLRRRAAGRAFAIGWRAAVLIAQQEQGYAGTRHPESGRLRWRRCEPALGRGVGLALLKRLDAAAAAIAGEELVQAEIVLSDFAAFLDLIEQGGDAAALARFFAARAQPQGATVYV
jgi:hypothetical protein